MVHPLRLLVFSHSAQLAGSEQLLLQLVRELVEEQDVACTVVVPAEGPLVAPLRAAGGEVAIWLSEWWCRHGAAAPDEVQRSLASGASTVVRNLAAARAFDPDAVLSITTVIPWGGLTAALLAKPHLWYVTDFGGATADAPEYPFPFEEIRRALIDGSDRVLVVSGAVRERLFSDVDDTLVVSPHLPLPQPSAAGDERGSPSPRPRPGPGPTRLAVFGNVRPSKGQWDAVAALAEISRRGLAAELLVVGHAGPEADELLEHARGLGVEDRVRILGFVADQRPWMAHSDIVVVPSHEETFSLVCLEAHLLGKPLVATRVGGIGEFVHDGVNGLSVPPRDPAALASAIERLIREPELGRRLTEAGRRQAEERFTAERFSGQVRRTLDEVVARGRRCTTPAPLLAPLESLAVEHQRLDRELRELRPVTEDLRTRLAAALDEQQRAARAVDELRAGLAAEERRRQEVEAETNRCADSLARVTSTRGWRLLDGYWRLAARLRRRG